MNPHAIAIQPNDQQAWLQARLQDVTASEVSCLFGISPYKSKYEMWQEKKKGEVVTIADNRRMFWGRKLERAIAEGICEERGWTLIDQPVTYYRDPRFNIGATPDFFVLDNKRMGSQKGMLQIKNVDFMVFRDKWSPADEGGEAPDYIELQLQHELTVTGCEWGAIGALVSGNDHHVYVRDAYSDIADMIQKKSLEFWESVKADLTPEINFERDADLIIRLNSFTAEGEVTDLTGDDEVGKLVAEYQAAGDEEKTASERKQGIKAQLFTMIGTAEAVLLPGGRKMNAKLTTGSQGTLVTPAMVGTYIGARAGYRQCRITGGK